MAVLGYAPPRQAFLFAACGSVGLDAVLWA